MPLTTGYHLGWLTPSYITFWLLDRLRVKVNIIICHAGRMTRRVLSLAYSLHDAAPRYLADLCVPAHSVHGRQQLRSTASGTLLVPRARTATGQRSFAVNGPRTWNSLPADLRTPDTTHCSFKRHLKAHLFQQ